MSGIERVLYCMAKYDEALRGELILTSSSKSEGNNTLNFNLGISNDHIQYEILSSLDYDRMKECFKNIRAKLVQKTNKHEIQKVCIQRGVRTSKDYYELCGEFTHFPDDPRISGMAWFDFLNPTAEKITIEIFANTVLQHNKRNPSDYAEWYSTVELPSLQNIRDGYFGDHTNFLEIIEKFTPVERRRR
jgi:hypothetical protein